ncbi:MAG: NTP transferase domain-containing protein [Verrucomicrobiae bacterium]|nr:NTP transferase domain-containing protein [Verrucomicrobiae bacterium]
MDGIDGVFLLTAGLGTRLRPLTLVRPKPCIPVLGKSPLERWVEILRPLRPRRVVLNTHHLPKQLEAHWKEIAPEDWSWAFSEEPGQILDTGGGLRQALEKIPGDGPVLVINGDVLARPPLEALIARHTQVRPLCTAWVHPRREPRTVRYDDVGQIITFRDREQGMAVFTGVYVIERRVLQWIPGAGPHSIITALEAALLTGQSVLALPDASAGWCDMGALEMYWKLHTDPDLAREWGGRPAGPPGSLAIGRNCDISPRATLINALLWNNVRLQEGSSLQDVIVTDGVGVSGPHHQEILTLHGNHPLLV